MYLSIHAWVSIDIYNPRVCIRSINKRTSCEQYAAHQSRIYATQTHTLQPPTERERAVALRGGLWTLPLSLALSLSLDAASSDERWKGRCGRDRRSLPLALDAPAVQSSERRSHVDSPQSAWNFHSSQTSSSVSSSSVKRVNVWLCVRTFVCVCVYARVCLKVSSCQLKCSQIISPLCMEL